MEYINNYALRIKENNAKKQKQTNKNKPNIYLRENRVFGADERELQDIRIVVQIGEKLLHGHADVEDLTLVVLVGVVTIILLVEKGCSFLLLI